MKFREAQNVEELGLVSPDAGPIIFPYADLTTLFFIEPVLS
jgi:hypothetical protein